MSAKPHSTASSKARPPMFIEAAIFGAGMLVFAPVGVIYGMLTNWNEPVGPTALFLTTGLSGMIAVYLYITGKRIDARPEDDPLGEIEQQAGEYGTFSPQSWWTLVVAIAAAIAFLGVAVGFWLVVIALPILFIGLVGLLFEFSRGQHGH